MIPFKEKGATKTWDIQQGYDLDCSCGEMSLSLSGVTILTSIEDRLDLLIDSGTERNSTLADILSELVVQNADVTQTFFTTTSAGSIPAGVQSYTIINLGSNPADPLTPIGNMTIGGITLNNKYVQFGNTTDTNQTLANPITYDPNGNTLAIIYNTL